MNILLILNESPYGGKRSYNALRLAASLAKRDDHLLHLFLVGEGVACGQRNQKTPNGYYNVERMLKGLVRKGVKIAV